MQLKKQVRQKRNLQQKAGDGEWLCFSPTALLVEHVLSTASRKNKGLSIERTTTGSVFFMGWKSHSEMQSGVILKNI